jgi:hypothetical protein
MAKMEIYGFIFIGIKKDMKITLFLNIRKLKPILIQN